MSQQKTKHFILGFWQQNKQAHRAKESVDTATIEQKEYHHFLQSLYSTVWVKRNRLTELNQCDRVNDCFSFLNSGFGEAGPQGPQVTVRLSVISAQSHSISSPHFITIVPLRFFPWHRHSTTSSQDLTNYFVNGATIRLRYKHSQLFGLFSPNCVLYERHSSHSLKIWKAQRNFLLIIHNTKFMYSEDKHYKIIPC